MKVYLLCFLFGNAIVLSFSLQQQQHFALCECDERTAFTPYVKVYNGRTDPYDTRRWGREIANLGPGLHDTSDLVDVYICLNGPVWLYFERKTVHGGVLDTPTFKVYKHECRFFNGQTTDPNSPRLMLFGVLLMGQPNDYRRPYLELFTAPLYNDAGKFYENVTSIMTIGRSECTIYRGRGSSKVGIKVLTNPDPDSPSHCRLSYKNIDTLDDSATLPRADPADKTVDRSEIKNALRNDDVLAKGDCQDPAASLAATFKQDKFVYANYHAAVTATINKKTDWQTKFAAITAPPRTVADLTDVIINKTGVVTDEEKRVAQFELDFAKKYDEAKKLVEAQPTSVVETLNTQITGAGTTLLAPPAAAPPPTDGIEKLIYDLNQSKITVADTEKKIKAAIADPTTAPPGGVDTLKANLITEKDTVVTNEKLVDAKAAELQNLLTQYNAMLERLNVLFPSLLLAETDFKGVTDPTAPSQAKFSSVDTLPIKTVIQMPHDPPPTPIPDPAPAPKCEKFPTVKEICKADTPEKTRACHLLNAAMGKPEICSLPEKPATAGGTTTPPPITDFIDKIFLELLRLIEDIFTKACPQKHFYGNPAKLMTHILECYLVKPKEDGGAGFQTGGSKPADLKDFWEPVVKALRICKKDERLMNFTQEEAGGEYKFYRLTDTGEWEPKHVEHFKEQADKQYSFNFALDLHFKIFATTMGLCMPSYHNKIPMITSLLYGKYTDMFFKPLRETWTDPTDNKVFKVIFGNFYNGNAVWWATHCMEASFVQSGDINFRPPRNLHVNAGSEHNFFTTGPNAYKKYQP